MEAAIEALMNGILFFAEGFGAFLENVGGIAEFFFRIAEIWDNLIGLRAGFTQTQTPQLRDLPPPDNAKSRVVSDARRKAS
jgi:hypothetical protein